MWPTGKASHKGFAFFSLNSLPVCVARDVYSLSSLNKYNMKLELVNLVFELKGRSWGWMGGWRVDRWRDGWMCDKAGRVKWKW